MLDKLDERLMQVKARIRSKQKLESMLRKARIIFQEQKSICTTLRVLLSDEQADVDKLEGLSLTGLFYSVLGTKDERLEKERQEFLAAKLKYDEAAESLEDARKEIHRLRDDLTSFANVDGEYDRLIKEKAKFLANAGDASAEKLLAISENLADLNSVRRELQEAIQAGEAALNSLQRVSTELASASNWGTWDMLGGGMITTMVKHSKIDTAKQYAHHAQQQLRRFQEELADADRRLHVSLEIDGFSKFADYFFDGLISDWIVQSKIHSASSACSSTVSQVLAAVNECRCRLDETEQDIKTVAQERQEFIEQA